MLKEQKKMIILRLKLYEVVKNLSSFNYTGKLIVQVAEQAWGDAFPPKAYQIVKRELQRKTDALLADRTFAVPTICEGYTLNEVNNYLNLN